MRAPLARLLVATLVAGLAVVAPVSRAEAVMAPRTLYHETRPQAGPVEPGFPIDHVGVVVPLPPGRDAGHDHANDGHQDGGHGVAGLAVRFRRDGTWGAWQPFLEDGAQAEGTWTSALVAADDAEAYQLRGVPTWARGVRVAAINTSDGEPVEVGRRPSGGADALTRCKARIDWGADETIRTSSRTYAPMRIATVHHTATQNADPDPDARVRAIYAYHVRTNGWADIGYQALISEDGTVYEGRWSGSSSPSCRTAGGTTLPFGHLGTSTTADIVVGAHSGGANTGNFGVSLLGTFTTAQPTAAARSALVAYLDELTARHGIAPDRQVSFSTTSGTRTVWTIAGHRDLSATECPGGALYAQLPTLRTEVAALQRDAAPTVTITAPATTDSHRVAETTPGAGANVTFTATATDESPATLTWRWTDGTGTSLATTASFARTLSVGTHPISVTVTDAGGQVATDVITVTVDAGATATAPTLIATLAQTNRQWRATLTWSGATSVSVHRSDAKGQRLLATVTGSSYVDVLGSKLPSTLAYRVCRTDAPTVCSSWVTLRP